MTERLGRIEMLVLAVATITAATALVLGIARPLGVALGGAAAWLDFVLIRRLATAALSRGATPLARLVPMALAKSFVLLVVPAAALLLPSTIVDGISFALGVTALPIAVVADAALPLPAPH